EWGRAGARAADALCVSGRHQHDWNPHQVRLEPVLFKAKPGEALEAELAVDNVTAKKRTLTVNLEGRGEMEGQVWQVGAGPGGSGRRKVTLKPAAKLEEGLHVFVLTAREGDAVEPGDAFIGVQVGGKP